MREMITLLNNTLLRLRRNRIVCPTELPVKVNLGSGLIVAPNWINIDISPSAFISGWPTPILRYAYKLSGYTTVISQEEFIRILRENIFIHFDLRLGIPFTDDSIDYIYTSHTLEHISKTSAQELMREAHRTLKRGGIIRVCVPDLEQAVKLYQQGNRTEALAYFFPDSEFEFHQHKYMYDFALLKQLLEDSGFKDVRRCEYQQGLMPDLDRLDNRPMQTLFVEAAKG